MAWRRAARTGVVRRAGADHDRGLTALAPPARRGTPPGFDPALLAELGRDAVFVIGAGREVVYANAEARGLIEAGYLLEVTPLGVVEAIDEGSRGVLRAAVIGALAQGRSTCLDIVLPCRPRHRLAVRPLAGCAGEELAVLTARNLDEYLHRCAAAAGDRFELSDAERRLAEGLLRGLSPGDYADACGIKISTVRSQMKALFAKTGVARQSDLMLRIGILAE